MKDEIPQQYLYTDIDVAEDMVPFPEELEGKIGAVSDASDPISLKFEKHGSNLKRFIHGLDSDEDSDEYEDLEIGSKKDRQKKLGGRKKPKAIMEKSTITNTSEVENNHPCKEVVTNGNQVIANDDDWEDDDCDCLACVAGIPKECLDGRGEVLFDTVDGDPEAWRIAAAFELLGPSDGQDPATDFRRLAFREAAKPFKQSWHAAVLDPEERVSTDGYNHSRLSETAS
jgi:hypothetical protein